LECAGNLRLASCNLWMGYCPPHRQGATNGDKADHTPTTTPTTTASSHSGLHHDFHDNLYVLMAGRKQFRLYAPSDAPYILLPSPLPQHKWHIHTNGLISYHDNPSRADGIPIQQQPQSGDGGGTTNHGNHHQGQGSRREHGGGGKGADGRKPEQQHSNGGDALDGGDDTEDEEEAPFTIGKGFDYQSSCDDDEEENPGDLDSNRDDFDDDDATHQGADADEETADDHDSDDEDDPQQRQPSPNLPPNFSSIDPALPLEVNRSKYPHFAQHARECLVNLTPGEILYLPASWFHCVTSSSSSSPCGTTTGTSTKEEEDGGLHIAINYWYYPPDNLVDYERPYHDPAFYSK
jgi:hypothetical protein